MLGRLLSHAFTPPKENPLDERTKSPILGANDSFNRPENDDELHPTFPVSFLEEADTRSLLYGQSYSPAAKLSLDIAKDIRVVIICDSSCVEGFIYDSVRECMGGVGGGPNASASPSRHLEKDSSSLMVSTLSRVSALTRSFSSTALNTNSLPNKNTATTTTLAHPNTIGSALSPVGHRPPPLFPGRANPPAAPYTAPHTPTHLSHHQDIAPMLQLSLLKDIVFGHSAMRFNGQLTKIHPLPKSERSSNKRAWIVSRIFKINSDESSKFDCSKPSTTSTTSTTTTSSAATAADEDDLPSWTPKSNTGVAPTLPSHAKDIRCAICISFNLPSESEDAITNHWTELCYALADLQAMVYSKLQRQLPQLILESRVRKLSTSSTNSLGGGAFRYNSRPKLIYTIDNDVEMQKSVEFFKSRFTNALAIPRVLCGQDNWGVLFRELSWASVKWENTCDGGFLAAMIATYIDFNHDLLKGIDEDDEIPTRTVILANNRIIARKLIFILCSFLRNRTSEQVRKRINLSTSLNDTFMKAHNPRSSSVSTTTSVSSSPRSKSSTKFSFVDGGWGISQSQSMIEPTGTVAIPHVVRPSFSSQSLAQSVGMHSTTTTDTGSFIASTWKNSRPGTFFSNFWTADASLPETPGSSYDDYYFNEQLANTDREMAYSLPNHPTMTNGQTTAAPSTGGSTTTSTASTVRPSLPRCHSSDRTTTTLNTINRAYYRDPIPHNLYHKTLMHNASDSDLTNSSDDNINYLTATPPNYRLINDQQEGQVFLDVSEPTTPLHYDDDSKPIVLPRVAGHILNFHPDFILQACPITRDLEEQISRAMLRDGEVNPISIATQRKLTTGESKKEALSKTLIINLRKRELSTYTLTATIPDNVSSSDSAPPSSTPTPTTKMIRETIFANHKPASEHAQTFATLSKKIHDIVEGENNISHSPNRGTSSSNLGLLIKGYESFFDLI